MKEAFDRAVKEMVCKVQYKILVCTHCYGVRKVSYSVTVME